MKGQRALTGLERTIAPASSIPSDSNQDAALEMAAAVFAAAEQVGARDGWITAEAAAENAGTAGWKDADRWQARIGLHLRDFPKTRLLAFGMSDYPQCLYDTQGPPALLFAAGPLAESLDDLGAAIAIVGSRQASSETLEAAELFGAELATSGCTVISGLAAGVDGAAHRGALSVEGRTVAVLGTGVEQVFPAEHAALQQQIANSGAIISQFPVDHIGSKTSFPARNNVIAGLAVDGLFVVDAAERSGTRIAVGCALRANRRVFLWQGGAGQRQWAQELIERNPLASEVATPDDLLAQIG